MAELSPSRERFLRYWAANMAVAFVESGGAPWLGFGYEDGEKQRMRQLAQTLPGLAIGIFFAATVVAYIALAALGIVGFMMPMLDWLYPDPSQLKPLAMVLILAIVAFFALGFGLPLAMRLGAWLGDNYGGGKPASSQPGDAALVDKIRFQLGRITLVMVGVFIPGCILFIIYDLHAGPFINALKAICALVTLGSIVRMVEARHR